RILVIGDLMLDKYVYGDVSRISPEAPIPVVHVLRQSFGTGGAANVAMNLAALGAKVVVAGFRGLDPEGEMLEELLNASGLEPQIVKRSDIPTTTKTRIVGGHQQMLRLDVEATAESDSGMD